MHPGLPRPNSKSTRSALPRAPPNFGNDKSLPTPNSAHYSPAHRQSRTPLGLDATIQGSGYPRLGADVNPASTRTPSQPIRVPTANTADYSNYGNDPQSEQRTTQSSDRKLWIPTEFAVGQDATADKRAHSCARSVLAKYICSFFNARSHDDAG